jgi:hypothetical protein
MGFLCGAPVAPVRDLPSRSTMMAKKKSAVGRMTEAVKKRVVRPVGKALGLTGGKKGGSKKKGAKKSARKKK